jgi:DNA-3-methyladenine glycosylase II
MLLDKIISHLRADSTMAVLIDQNILPENRSTGNIYQDLIRSITGQQLSVKVAKVIYERFLAIFSGLEPSPEELIKLEVEDLRAVGYSKQKASYVLNVGHFFHHNPSDFDFWQQKEDQEIIKKLTEIKGVGKWTAEMILMFTLERQDVLPLDDYGIQSAIKKHYYVTAEKKELKIKMQEIAEPWRPYRTIASRYLWASLNNEPID